jgi:carboxypeptidase Taq
MWENNVGRSDAFWQPLYRRFQEAFAPGYDGVSREQFIAAINTSQPGLIRVDADELTYPMHVFLRFEIEQDVLEGRLAVKDIPAVWNAKMQEYLGITPPDDARGCLQDIHWSCGLVGYFPTYVIGSMLAAQQYAAAKRDIPDLEARFAEGNTRPLQEWLRTRIHEPACRYPTKELILRATGKEPSSDDYIAYLSAKFG